MIKVQYDMKNGLQILEHETVHKVRGRVVAGSPRRKRRWTVKGSYWTPSGVQEFTVAPKKKCHLTDLSPAIEAAVREDRELTGSVDDIKWTAIGR